MTSSLELVRGNGGALEHYDPNRGLKAVAVAEAAERHFRRAKDATGLLAAIERKLAEQRTFIIWWDAQNKQAGARTRGFRSETPSLETLGVDKLTVHRWRVRLKDEGKFQAALAHAQARCVKVCEAGRGQSDYARMTYTGEVEWYTPAEYLAAARDVLRGIDLDPASSDAAQRTVKAARYFTRQDDGLTQPWPGRVWLNPPYSQPAIAHFIAKLVEEYTAGRTTAAILLTHNCTDTVWFHQAAGACAAICFTRGRIAFIDTLGDRAAPTQGQVFFYYGQDRAAFQERFADIGLLVARP